MKQTVQTTDRPTGSRPRTALRFIPAAVWMAVIFAMSSRTGDDMNALLPFFQKLFPQMQTFDWGHFIAYFILAAAFDYGIGAKSEKVAYKALIIALCGLYGVTDEFHQSFVGGRTEDWHDIRNDMIGAFVWTLMSALPAVKRLWRKMRK